MENDEEDTDLTAGGCPDFSPEHVGDPVMESAHELSHALFCDSGMEVPYLELAEALRLDVAAGADPQLSERALEVLSGACCLDDDADAAEIASVDARYPRLAALIDARL